MDAQSPFSGQLDTNYSATQAEVEEIEMWIGRYQTLVEQMDKELADLDERRKAVEGRRLAHLELLQKHRNLVSAIRRIPDDILSIILQLEVERINQTSQAMATVRATPYQLSWVCRRWRAVARSS